MTKWEKDDDKQLRFENQRDKKSGVRVGSAGC